MPEPSVEYPVFMMQGIRREVIEQLIAGLGGEVVEVREHITEWSSYRYTTRRVS
jgi:hypothetical protein